MIEAKGYYLYIDPVVMVTGVYLMFLVLEDTQPHFAP